MLLLCMSNHISGISHCLKGEVEKQVQTMLDNDIIGETVSEWSSPILLVSKKTDKSNEKMETCYQLWTVE